MVVGVLNRYRGVVVVAGGEARGDVTRGER